jgi:hypothetical protein
VENYVAVLVSCMSAVSSFAKRHILPTRFGQYLRSKLLVRVGMVPSSPDEQASPSPQNDVEAAREIPSKPPSKPRFPSRVLSAMRSTNKDRQVSLTDSERQKDKNALDKESQEEVVHVNAAFEKK